MDDNRKKALAQALGQIEKQFGKGSVMRMGDGQAARDIEAISTGSIGLDVALDLSIDLLANNDVSNQVTVFFVTDESIEPEHITGNASQQRKAAAVVDPSAAANDWADYSSTITVRPHEYFGPAGILNHMNYRLTIFRTGTNIKGRDLVGTLLIVATRNLYRVACIADIYKLDAFFDASVIDIKTGNNSFGQAHNCDRSVSVTFASGVYKLVFILYKLKNRHRRRQNEETRDSSSSLNCHFARHGSRRRAGHGR